MAQVEGEGKRFPWLCGEKATGMEELTIFETRDLVPSLRKMFGCGNHHKGEVARGGDK